MTLSTPITTYLTKVSGKVIPANGFEEFLLALLFLSTIFLVARSKKITLPFNLVVSSLVFGLFVTLMLVLYPVSTSALVGFIVYIRLFAALWLGYFLGLYLNHRQLQVVQKFVITLGVALVCVAFIVWLLPQSALVRIGYDAVGVDQVGRPSSFYAISQKLQVGRLFGTFRSPNALGVLLLLPFSFLLFCKDLFSSKNLRLAFGAVLAAGIVLSFSRSAWLGAFIISAYFLFKNRYEINVKYVYGAVLVALVCALFLIFSPFGKSIILHQSENQANGSTSSRLDSLSSSLSDIAYRPVGYGLGTVGGASRIDDSGLGIQTPENWYLFAAIELGVVGLVLFLAFVFATFTQLKQIKDTPSAESLIATLTALLVIGLFLPIWADKTVTIFWWLIVGISISKTSTRDNKQQTLKS